MPKTARLSREAGSARMTKTPSDEASASARRAVRYVCPNCRRALDGEQKADGSPLRRCAEHDLVYVDEREVPGHETDAFLGKTLVDRFIVLGRLG